MRRYLKFLAPLAAVLAIAGCGGGSSSTHSAPAPSPVHTVAPASRCTPGNSFMGCSLPAPTVSARANLGVPAGRKFIDVSDWQPSVNWKAVKASGVFGVVIKAGEGLRQDPTWSFHLAGARAAGLQVMAYWFVRPVGCTSEIASINHVVPHGMRVLFDMEVPGITGYDSCLRGPVQSHTGILPADYTSPGSWPGGAHSAGLGLWQAEYGPTLHPFWTPVLAWQYTDAASVPGVGRVDESVDFSLFPKPAPQPVDIGGAQHYERYPNVAWKIDGVRIRERNTVMTWDSAKCENPVKRPVCKATHNHLIKLLGRDQTVASQQTKKEQDANYLPGRIQGLSHRINNGRGIVTHWL